ncbi:MAG: hypothetical protein QOI22_227 [Verrucomicrobiota bacterium]|jgi:hypothetical protein
MRRSYNGSLSLFLFMAVLALTGCVDLTGRSAAQLSPMRSEDKPRYQREGQVYCILGWLGIWSRGMDVIAQRVEKEVGVHATSLANQEWRKLVVYLTTEHKAGRWYGPLVLVGHSYGCDDQVRVSRQLNEKGIAVDLLLLVDPTTPGTIPPNVKRCVDIYKSHPGMDALPFFRGIKVQAADPSRTLITNIDLRRTDVGFATEIIDHFNIAKIPGVQDMVLAEIRKTCLPRSPARPVARTAGR